MALLCTNTDCRWWWTGDVHGKCTICGAALRRASADITALQPYVYFAGMPVADMRHNLEQLRDYVCLGWADRMLAADQLRRLDEILARVESRRVEGREQAGGV